MAKFTEEFYEQKGMLTASRATGREAINSYLKAIELDPESPAVEAKQMLDDIMNYYHKDYYNP